MMDAFWTKVFEYLTINIRVVVAAPSAFLAVLAVAFGAAYLAASARYQGIIDQKNAAIESLTTQRDGLRSDLAQAKANSPQPSAIDENAIYQLGNKVGDVVGVQIDYEHGSVKFAQVYHALRWVTDIPFEFRSLVLKFQSAKSSGAAFMVANEPPAVMFEAVECKIVGRSGSK